VATLLGFNKATALGVNPIQRDFKDRGMGVASILL
jgi:hypothetical protein